MKRPKSNPNEVCTTHTHTQNRAEKVVWQVATKNANKCDDRMN